MSESYAAGPSVSAIADVTVGDLLARAVAAAPDRLALVAGAPEPDRRRVWTYQQLAADVRAAAGALAGRFAPGERVAVWAPNVPEWVVTQFAAALAGVVLVTVNPAFRPKEAAYVLRQSRSAGVLVLPEHRGSRLLDAVASVRPDCPELREVISFADWDDFLAEGTKGRDRLPPVASSDPVMIQYTSGTTGFPKGALLHHRGLVNNAAHTADRLGVREGCVWLTTMPLFHTGGCVLCVLGAVSKHATQVLVERFDPGLVLELVEAYGVNTMLAVPTMLVAMLEHGDFAGRDLSSMEAIFSGGALVPAALVRTFEDALGAPFAIVYGQTECSPVVTMTHVDDTAEDKGATIGPPLPHVEVKVTDPVTGATVPPGIVGELCTRGYHVMCGYHEDPDATAAAIDAEGWLHTGDLGTMDGRGYCTVEGRLSDMIIRGGENIYPRELEDLLFRHPGIADVAVVGLPDDYWGEVVAAFVRPAPGVTVTQAELVRYCREHLAPFKAPTVWPSVESFPMTESGKVQKFRLRELWAEGGVPTLPLDDKTKD